MPQINTPPTAAASAAAAADNYTRSIGKTHCILVSSSIAASFSILFFNVVTILAGCKLAHTFLRRLRQHRMIADFIIGLMIGNVGAIKSIVEQRVLLSATGLGSTAFALYLFVLGLEMDPKTILRLSTAATKTALIGIASTIAITLSSTPIVRRTAPDRTIPAIAIALAATSSPILTRLIAELKINKSEIGRLAVRAALANDMICTSLVALGVALYSSYGTYGPRRLAIRASLHVVAIFAEAWVISRLVNPVLRKINERNPEGRPIRGFDMAAVCAAVGLLCYCSAFIGFDPSFNAFVVGLFLSREGRISNFLISRINFTLTTIMLPVYVVLVGVSCDYGEWIRKGERINWVKVVVVGLIGAVGKMAGTVGYSLRRGMKWPEAVALGLLLNVKGYFHIFCAHKAATTGLIDANTMMIMILSTITTLIPTPLAVSFIIHRARAVDRPKPMGLQWSKPGAELRILVGLHGPQDVPMAVSVMEAMRGRGDGGLVAFVVDMVEMTDKAAATLVHAEGMDAVTVADEGVVEMREQIGLGLAAYVEDGVEGVAVRRMLSVSSFDNMHQDICTAAQDCLTVITVLPFHRRQLLDGTMDVGHPGHRLLNQKVLQLSPSSVAILVNRNSNRAISSSLSSTFQNTLAVFIGGADDREALSYASLISHHPAIRLTVLRFLTTATSKRRVLAAVRDQEAEEKADDEFFTGFYKKHLEGGGGIEYVEKMVENGAETVAMLRESEGRFQLFIVGRGRDRVSVLTAGMSEWAECPELGPIGDVLAASDFSASASVMVVQQHDVRKGFDVIDDEFLPL